MTAVLTMIFDGATSKNKFLQKEIFKGKIKLHVTLT
jgi:hypothetical protein